MSDSRRRVGKSGGEDGRSKVASYIRYSYLGLQFLLSIGLPLAGGLWLDHRLGTVVLFTLLGLALGFTAGIYSLYGEVYGRRGGGGRVDRGDGGGSEKP